ncbi:hypothetical protein [Yinghuangia soli]|uniref:Glycosyl transferases group 1 n=1 Tax=Yinghuangia soli TaxID=2908204 RepID=A0AA41Q721_9ACTN|nr:hypothetical protein [Yinghuangia soli]MCF2532673.1 hypothetical protein [Yinghuangia soli]
MADTESVTTDGEPATGEPAADPAHLRPAGRPTDQEAEAPMPSSAANGNDHAVPAQGVVDGEAAEDREPAGNDATATAPETQAMRGAADTASEAPGDLELALVGAGHAEVETGTSGATDSATRSETADNPETAETPADQPASSRPVAGSDGAAAQAQPIRDAGAVGVVGEDSAQAGGGRGSGPELGRSAGQSATPEASLGALVAAAAATAAGSDAFAHSASAAEVVVGRPTDAAPPADDEDAVRTDGMATSGDDTDAPERGTSAAGAATSGLASTGLVADPSAPTPDGGVSAERTEPVADAAAATPLGDDEGAAHTVDTASPGDHTDEPASPAAGAPGAEGVGSDSADTVPVPVTATKELRAVGADGVPTEDSAPDASAATPPAAECGEASARGGSAAGAPAAQAIGDHVAATSVTASTDPAADPSAPTPDGASAEPVAATKELQAVGAQGVPSDRRGLPRVVLTARAPLAKDSAEIVQARALAQAGHYVMLATPAETAEVATSVSVERDGVLRVLGVPVDADAAAEISVARSEVAALAGPGLLTGLRRKLARRRLAAVRKDVWDGAAADPSWPDRCDAAYRPYIDAFAPAAQAPVGQAGSVEATAAAPGGIALGIGPTNMAGQAHEWARAAQANLDGVRAETYALSSGNTFGFASDRSISTDDWLSRAWQLRQLAYVLDNFTHVLAENAMPPFGRLNGPWANFDLAELQAAGVAVAMAFHGSEIRNPAAHRERVRFSPFDPDHELTRALQSKVDRLGPVVRAMDVPKFVSTPDLLADVPDAVWLPVVVDPGLWAAERAPLERDRPVVVHAPSSPFTKGTALIEPVVEELHDAGLIEYRRIKGVGHAEMPALLADADIVLDQFVFGAYGVMSAQAMAAGRVTVAYIDDAVAAHLPDDLPIVNADPETLHDELLRILDERDQAAATAARGPAYVRANHDGTRSARVLAGFLGVAP